MPSEFKYKDVFRGDTPNISVLTVFGLSIPAWIMERAPRYSVSLML